MLAHTTNTPTKHLRDQTFTPVACAISIFQHKHPFLCLQYSISSGKWDGKHNIFFVFCQSLIYLWKGNNVQYLPWNTTGYYADTKIAPECEKYLNLVQGKRASKYAIAQDSEGSNAAPLRDLQSSFVYFADLSLGKVATTCNPTLVLFWLLKETDIMKDWFFIHCLDTTDQDKS